MSERSNAHAASLEADGSPAAHRRDAEAKLFADYAAIIRRLRAPDGCPWDHKQTLRSLRRFIVEESFEALAAIEDLGPGDGDSSGEEADQLSAAYLHVAEELGDVLLVTLLLSDALEAAAGIRLEDILRENGEKLIRRHPHVFGDVSATHADEVVRNWDQIKREQEGRTNSVGSVSAGLPPLERAHEIQKKAAKLGFDWPSWEPVLEKIREEAGELEEEIRQAGNGMRDNPHVEDELGDLLFSVVNLARHLKADPSVALDHTNRRFMRRFGYIEERLAAHGRTPSDCSLEELDTLWHEAKLREATETGR